MKKIMMVMVKMIMIINIMTAEFGGLSGRVKYSLRIFKMLPFFYMRASLIVHKYHNLQKYHLKAGRLLLKDWSSLKRQYDFH